MNAEFMGRFEFVNFSLDDVLTKYRLADMPTLIRETVYALYHAGRFVAAYTTREQAETVARGRRGAFQIVAMTGKREEQS